MVRNDTAGVIFSNLSEFAKFAEKQKSRGLMYYKGGWLPTAEVLAMRQKEEEAKLRREELWRSLKGGASYGVVVLKNGAVLHGKLSGNNDFNILFVSDSRDYFLSLDDVAPLSLIAIIARGKLDKARTSLLKAKRSLKNDRGMAMYHAEEALKQLNGISKKLPAEYKKSESMLAEVSSMIVDVDKSLTSSGEAIYRNAIFPVATLDYHLKQGHVLLRKKIWLFPEQLCKECHSSGNLTCRDVKEREASGRL